MVEEALVSGHPVRACALRRVPQEAQCGQHALAGVGPCDVAALDTDRIRSEAEADSRDARERWRRIAVGDEPVLRIRGVPEEPERSFFEVDQDRLDQRRERSLRRVGEAAVPVRNGRAVPQQNRDGDEHHRGDHHDPASSEHRFLHARQSFAAPARNFHGAALRAPHVLARVLGAAQCPVMLDVRGRIPVLIALG